MLQLINTLFIICVAVLTQGFETFQAYNPSPQCLNAVAVGDSITVGVDANTQPYPATIATALASTVSNQGIAGAGWGGLDSVAAANVDPLKTSLTCNGAQPYLLLFAGTNDISIGGLNGAQTYSLFQTYLSNRLAAGWQIHKIVVSTTISRSDGNTTQRSDYNALLVSGASTYGYTVVREDQDSNMGCNNCYMNTTYFQVDGIHPTNTGAQVLANLICIKMSPNAGSAVCPAY